MTIRLELLFFFTLPLFPLYVVAAPLAACNSLELDYPLTPRLGQDALRTEHPPLPPIYYMLYLHRYCTICACISTC